MRLDNTAIVHTLLESKIPTNDLVVYFDSIIKILKKYGKNIQSTTFAGIIKDVDPTLTKMIEMLVMTNKCTIADVKALTKLLKQTAKDYKQVFAVELTDNAHHGKAIEEKLATKFAQAHISKSEAANLWAYVHGEGRYYKRDIDQDIQKMLW